MHGFGSKEAKKVLLKTRLLEPVLWIREFWSDPDLGFKMRSDPYPVFEIRSDPDPVFEIRSNPDPGKTRPDPQPCLGQNSMTVDYSATPKKIHTLHLPQD